MTREPIRAVVWDDAVTQSLRRQLTADNYAARVEAPSWVPDCPARTDLLQQLRAAARAEAAAWSEFAHHARECFESAAEAERQERRARYDDQAAS